MDDKFQIALKTICCTCLSLDRKLTQLCKINDGVNKLYFLLSYDSEAYEAMFRKPTTNLYICWECEAQINRLFKFREKAGKAQRILSDIEDETGDINIKQNLSKLSNSHKKAYDYIYKYNDYPDNFVDCNSLSIKNEILNIYTEPNDTTVIKKPAEIKPLLEIKPLKLKAGRTQLKKRKIDNQTTDNKYYTTVQLSDEDMYESIELRRKEDNFVAAEFKCESCVLVFNYGSELNEHNDGVHLQKPRHIQCKICKMYISYWRLTLHESYHRRLYKCSTCDSTLCAFRMLKHLRGHSVPSTALYDLKKIATVLNPLLICKKERIVQNNSSGYACSECNKCFDKQRLRYKHILQCHREGFKCDTCGKTFIFKNTLNKHIQTHAPPLPREECSICKKMVRSDRLKAHAKIHTDRQKRYCSICNKYFISSDSYEKHLRNSRTHAVHDVLKYKCSLCPKGFRTMTSLSDHINYNHMGKTQYKCPVCDKALATRRSVTRHVRRAHQGLKEKMGDKILCQICGKAFRDKKCLLEHELIHSGQKPLSCDLCGRGFRQSACLYTHRRRVHKMAAKRRVVYDHVE